MGSVSDLSFATKRHLKGNSNINRLASTLDKYWSKFLTQFKPPQSSAPSGRRRADNTTKQTLGFDQLDGVINETGYTSNAIGNKDNAPT